jgi:MSHA biogenesis protein MshI
VIDIEETAQRNIAALYETEERAIAVVHFAEQSGLLTINYAGEIYLARRFEIGLQQLDRQAGAGSTESLERLAIEIQRTLDHFDRSFRSIPVAKLLVAPTPSETGTCAFLRARLGLECDDIDLRDVLAFQAPAPEKEAQWRLFHHFGAALRHEAKAL